MWLFFLPVAKRLSIVVYDLESGGTGRGVVGREGLFVERGTAGPELAAGAGPEGSGGGVAVDGEGEELFENCLVGCNGGIIKLVTKVFAERFNADFQTKRDLVMRKA